MAPPCASVPASVSSGGGGGWTSALCLPSQPGASTPGAVGQGHPHPSLALPPHTGKAGYEQVGTANHSDWAVFLARR